MIFLTTAKCTRCLGTATAETFEDARKQINHAIGLSRGIKCGDNYNQVEEIKEMTTEKPSQTKQKTVQTETKIPESPISEKTIKEKPESKPKLTTKK